MAIIGPKMHSFIPELDDISPEGKERLVQSFDNVAHRSCLLNYLQDDSMWLIKSPASFGKEALQLFAKIRKSFTNEGGTEHLAARAVHSMAKNLGDIQHLAIETEGADEAPGIPMTVPKEEDDEVEDKIIWRSENADTDLEKTLPEFIRTELSQLFGVQLILNLREKGVVVRDNLDDEMMADLYQRLSNIEDWAHFEPITHHQIQMEDETGSKVTFPKIPVLPEGLIRRILLELVSNWRDGLHVTHICRMTKDNVRTRGHKIIEIECQPVDQGVSWGYFYPETIKIKPFGNWSQGSPRTQSVSVIHQPPQGQTMMSKALTPDVDEWLGAVEKAGPSAPEDVDSNTLLQLEATPSQALNTQGPKMGLLIDIDTPEPTMNKNAPSKKGFGSQRYRRQNRAQYNAQRQQLITEIYGTPPPARPQMQAPHLTHPSANAKQSKATSIPTIEDTSVDELYEKGIEILGYARNYRGKLYLEVQLTQNLLWLPNLEDREFAHKSHSQNEAESYLNDQTTRDGIQSTATKMLTTYARDMDYLIGIKDANRQDVFVKEPFNTDLIFEIVCQMGGDYFIIEINQDGDDLLKNAPQVIGSVYWHYAKRIYDARVHVAGTYVTAVHDNISLRELKSNLLIHYPSQDIPLLPELQTHVSTKDFQIKYVFIKRHLDFKPKSPSYENIALRITEVHDLIIFNNGKGGFRACAAMPAQMASKVQMWYEASLIAIKSPPQFDENVGLEAGCKAGWEPAEVLTKGRLAALKELTTLLVGRMDNVGLNNQGPRGSVEELRKLNERWVRSQPEARYW